jgi:hypothetical protein
LSDRGENNYTFHWGLYLQKAPKLGCIYHLINDTGQTTWRFESRPSHDVIYSQILRVAVKIGVIEPGLQQAFLERLQQIPIAYSTRFHENIICRVWLKEALFALDDEGYIQLTQGLNDIEEETRNTAIRNMSGGRKTIVRSKGTQA